MRLFILFATVFVCSSLYTFAAKQPSLKEGVNIRGIKSDTVVARKSVTKVEENGRNVAELIREDNLEYIGSDSGLDDEYGNEPVENSEDQTGDDGSNEQEPSGTMTEGTEIEKKSSQVRQVVSDEEFEDKIVVRPWGNQKTKPTRGRKFDKKFPKSCPCKRVPGPPGYCYEFVKSPSRKCIRRRCTAKYMCVSKKYLKKYLKKNKRGKTVEVCLRRISRRKVVPYTRKTWKGKGNFRKGFCRYIRTKKTVFYVPYSGEDREDE